MKKLTLPIEAFKGQSQRIFNGRQTQLRIPIPESRKDKPLILEVGDEFDVIYQHFDSFDFKVVVSKRERMQDATFYDWCKWYAPEACEKERALATNVGRKYQVESCKMFCDSIYGEGTWNSNPLVEVIEFVNLH
jgi:hypothetical protein